MCFILPTLVPWYCWGETFPHSLFVATFLRYAVVLNATWLVNSAAHLYGYRPYDKNISSRENILVSLGAVGKSAVHSKTTSLSLLMGHFARSQKNQNDLFGFLFFFFFLSTLWVSVSNIKLGAIS
jgi:hypothetical protein